ncbi:MAG: hypothetical protein QOE97_1312 [Pseudonocardiales bacterium]|nr:hypothetical protein [Pseudonocardiales bacterium]
MAHALPDPDRVAERHGAGGRSGGSFRVGRRGVLLAALGAVLAAGAGTGAGFLRPLRPGRPAQQPPADLVAALGAERALIAQIQATLTADASLRATLSGVRADHEQHVAALEVAIGAITGKPPVPSAAESAPQALTRAQLAATEGQAASRAAARAARLTGRDAALLASIAACEQTHRELLA